MPFAQIEAKVLCSKLWKFMCSKISLNSTKNSHFCFKIQLKKHYQTEILGNKDSLLLRK